MKEKSVSKKVIKEIKQFFLKTHNTKVVLGLSGGLDSAVCAALLTRSIGAKNVTALIMPVKGISSKKNFLDAKNLAKKLKINYFFIELNRFNKSYFALPWKQSKRSAQNLLARQRALILYNFANSKGTIVCGTGNKSEILIGYFTKYGDGAADFFPIGGLYKTQVRALAKELELETHFLEKSPSAELALDQTDEKEIGLKYEEIDKILHLLVEKKISTSQILKKGVSKKSLERISNLLEQNMHKTEMPPIIQI